MAEMKPVPGQILLTDAEFSVLITAAANQLPQLVGEDNDARRRRGEKIVRNVMRTLNEWRFGAPAGEVRRSVNGSLAVREQRADGQLGWDVTRLEAEDETTVGLTADDIKRWPSVHDESWLGRLTEDDFKAKTQ